MARRFLVFASEAGLEKSGWQRGDGDMVFGNPKFALVQHVVWCEEDDTAPNGRKVLFDQILRCEAGGGVSVVVDEEGRIGLMQAFRPQTNDQVAWSQAWPEVDLSGLGRASWELPRGFAKVDERGAESGADAALRETEEETQSVVVSSQDLGYVCDNTSSSPQLTVMKLVRIDLTRKPHVEQDPNEKFLSPLTFFDREGLTKLVKSGDLYCAFTLAGIAKYMMLNT